ncbi:FAD-dependent oxidoreductase [Pseudomonas fluorescens]|uniref:FAD-dependent oxidoreductase n=1 Tax=Pseudomonas fluorescens TaxID=294 RepID=UPI002ACA8084|nr:FAD-dependent oxidoreductase [Pseudomonas fluorescens]MDZ5434242.1 FAD-dependent oxidoreductase [Pseudomonas fluorescens]
MQNTTNDYDAVIIGGGFYGVAIATYLACNRGIKRILVIEQEAQLMTRASYNNQARVHNGYHYPRSFTTAYRSRVNLPRFVNDWPQVIKKDFTKIYAIARRNSKVTAKQFERFCSEIGASVKPINASLNVLFEPHLIEKAFLVEEYAFDSRKLCDWAKSELARLNIKVSYNTRATHIYKLPEGQLGITLTKDLSHIQTIKSRLVFNCTYSGLNQFSGDFTFLSSNLKHEITEMALVKMPSELLGLGITVMDGPFFSAMPFPSRNLHTLSHVRYTPHLSWKDNADIDPYLKLKHYNHNSRTDRMIRDVSRYIPSVAKAQHVESLFEIKTVLTKNEGDDGRPILFEKHAELPGCYSILGGKIDNIYDIFEKLDSEILINSPNIEN